MHPVVNTVVQLQELTLIRDEQKMARGGGHCEELDKSIRMMMSELPAEIRTLTEKMRLKDPIVAVPVSHGNCSGCGLKLPISLAQAVRQARQIHTCPNCARIFYDAGDAPRRVGRAPRRMEPRKPGIARFSAESLMIPSLAAGSKEGVIEEIALKMQESGFVDKADKLVEAALRREAIVSTSMDHGLAFPHVRSVEGGGIALSLGVSKKGIRWDAKGRSLTRLVFFIVIPTAASAFYLRLLGGLAEALTKADARKLLQTSKDQETLWKNLLKVTRTTVK